LSFIYDDDHNIGIGCEKSGPVLPIFLAHILSKTLKLDIEWKAVGIVGGDVTELRSSVHKDKDIQYFLSTDNDYQRQQEMLQSSHDSKIELNHHDNQTAYIIVIICGLNDWRKALENFPHGNGPISFRRELKGLIHDIKESIASQNKSNRSYNCRFFIPAIPFTVADTDPKWLFKEKPLSFFVNFISFLYDIQKRNIAFEDDYTETIFIESPTTEASYATPGTGNLSSDGVHPSEQGCK
jgi:hypothetical protein